MKNSSQREVRANQGLRIDHDWFGFACWLLDLRDLSDEFVSFVFLQVFLFNLHLLLLLLLLNLLTSQLAQEITLRCAESLVLNV